jgi:hypothetical protein
MSAIDTPIEFVNLASLLLCLVFMAMYIRVWHRRSWEVAVGGILSSLVMLSFYVYLTFLRTNFPISPGDINIWSATIRLFSIWVFIGLGYHLGRR